MFLKMPIIFFFPFNFQRAVFYRDFYAEVLILRMFIAFPMPAPSNQGCPVYVKHYSTVMIQVIRRLPLKNPQQLNRGAGKTGKKLKFIISEILLLFHIRFCEQIPRLFRITFAV